MLSGGEKERGVEMAIVALAFGQDLGILWESIVFHNLLKIQLTFSLYVPKAAIARLSLL